MSVVKTLQQRSESKCELCGSVDGLNVFEIPPASDGGADQCAFICQVCQGQIENPETVDVNHWRCLNDSMWSQVPAIQVLAWRMLTHLKTEGWPRDLLEMLYLDDVTLDWAKSGVDEDSEQGGVIHRDSNGAILEAGDTVILIKDLVVKGAGFTAKRGTAVRSISLVMGNPEHIEGKVSGQQIVILTKFVKKSG